MELTDKLNKIKIIKPNYDYSKAIYKGCNIPITIGCLNKDHGYFDVSPSNFLRSKNGCPICESENKKYNTEKFIEKAKNSSKVKKGYDYSKVKYIDSITKVIIGCYNPKGKIPEHTFFEISPANFLSGYGCAICNGKKESNTEEFIQKAKLIFPDYDYSKVNYISNKIKVDIGCNIDDHGFWSTTPGNLLNEYGCPICGKTKKCNTNDFIKKAKKKRPNYDYSKVDYKDSKTKVIIGCDNIEHGFFEISPAKFLSRGDCPKCSQGFGEYFTK